MINAIMLEPRDSVATVTLAIKAGATVNYYCGQEVRSIIAVEDIPIYHKIALVNIPCGDTVYKYGECIGTATKDIHAGEYVHTHNITSKTRLE